MNVSDLLINQFDEMIGTLVNRRTKKAMNDVQIIFENSSKNKISQIITCGDVTYDTQVLCIREMNLNNVDAEPLLEEYSPWEKTKNGYSLSNKPTNPDHYCADLSTIAPMKKDVNSFYGINMHLENILFDFSHSKIQKCEDMTTIKNISVTLFPGRYYIDIPED